MSWNAFFQVIGPVTVSCYFGLDQYLSATIHFSTSITTDMNALNTLCVSNQIFFDMFQIASLTLNLCLCIDLIMTIYSPFTPASNRLKWYYLSSAVTALILGLSTYAQY